MRTLIISKICNRRPLVGAVGAYKRGDARRKDSDLCFAHSLVLICTSDPASVSAHFLASVTVLTAPIDDVDAK